MNQTNTKKGFTLLELLIVIGIIAILSVVVILVLNPAETLKKSRDTQRFSDLATLKTALGLYMTTVSPVYLAGTANTACQSTLGTWTVGEDKIYYSLDGATDITDMTLDGVTFTSTFGPAQSLTPTNTDGTGWLPVDLADIVGGSPISYMPVDPTNNFVTGSVSSLLSGDLFYRYGCANVGSVLNFEINATLESAEFTTSPNDRRIKDGGNSTLMYEVGTINTILGANSASVTTDGF